MTFTVVPIDPVEADRLRAGASIVRVADEVPGYPCRQCLRDAELGEELVLVAHDPFAADPLFADVDSPYRSPGPVYLHRATCADRVDTSDIPDQLYRRSLSVRGFDRDAMMRTAAVVDGSGLTDELARAFANPTVGRVHVHNAGAGCFAAAVVRR